MTRHKLVRGLLLATMGVLPATPGHADSLLAEGSPPLTRVMVQQLASIFTFLVDARLTPAQYDRFELGVVRYWQARDEDAIKGVLGNLKYAGRRQELEQLRAQSQQAFIDSWRLEDGDPVYAVLIEAYDAAHPRANHRKRTVTDLAGTWKRSDALMGSRYPDGRVVGLSYTDSGTIEIFSDGRFRHVQAHNHCSGSGGCCRLDGTTEEGTLTLDGANLVFDVRSGSQMTQDGCSGSGTVRRAVLPHRQSFSWSLQKNPNNRDQPILCWNVSPDKALCYDKQP